MSDNKVSNKGDYNNSNMDHNYNTGNSSKDTEFAGADYMVAGRAVAQEWDKDRGGLN